MSTLRTAIKIELSHKAKEHLRAISRDMGMTQVVVASRIMEWFATEATDVQTMILARYPVGMRLDVSKLILKRMAKDEE